MAGYQMGDPVYMQGGQRGAFHQRSAVIDCIRRECFVDQTHYCNPLLPETHLCNSKLVQSVSKTGFIHYGWVWSVRQSTL